MRAPILLVAAALALVAAPASAASSGWGGADTPGIGANNASGGGAPGAVTCQPTGATFTLASSPQPAITVPANYSATISALPQNGPIPLVFTLPVPAGSYGAGRTVPPLTSPLPNVAFASCSATLVPTVSIGGAPGTSSASAAQMQSEISQIQTLLGQLQAQVNAMAH